MNMRGIGFWVLQVPGWVIVALLILGQGIAAFDYELAVRMGTQDSAALGITVYWPVVCLATVVAARDAEGWNPANVDTFWIVLPLIALWGAWGLWHLSRTFREHQLENRNEST